MEDSTNQPPQELNVTSSDPPSAPAQVSAQPEATPVPTVTTSPQVAPIVEAAPADTPPVQSPQPSVADQPASVAAAPQATASPVAASTGIDTAATEQAAPSTPPVAAPSKSKKRSKWLIPAVLVGVLFFAGGAAAYITVFNKSPQKAFESALVNTGKGLEKLIYIDTSESTSLKVDGSFALTSPVAADGELSGQWQGPNGSATASAGTLGVRVNSEIITIAADESSTPDIYIKVDGLEGLGGLLASFVGSGSAQISGVLDTINDQWYVVDHTLVDQALNSQAEAGSDKPELSEEDISQIQAEFITVMQERFFGTEEDKAVFKINEEIGKEDFEGTSTYKLKVGVDKDNFIAFVNSFEAIITDTKLNDLVAASAPGTSIDQYLNFEEITKQLEDEDFSEYTADVWVEENGSIIRNIRIYPVEGEESSNYLDLMMPYEGGDVIPIELRATVDDSDVKGVLAAGVEFNQDNGSSKLWFDVDMDSSSTKIVAKGELKTEYSNDSVEVEKPSGAKSILELVGALNGNLLGVNSDGSGLLDTRFAPAQLDDVQLPFDSLLQ